MIKVCRQKSLFNTKSQNKNDVGSLEVQYEILKESDISIRNSNIHNSSF